MRLKLEVCVMQIIVEGSNKCHTLRFESLADRILP